MNAEKIENRIAILVYLPSDISSAIIDAKEEINISYPNHETQTPHITLYSCKFSESKFLTLVEEIKNLQLQPFTLKLDKMTVVENVKVPTRLFTSIGFQDESPLRELHEKVWPVANRLRGDLVREKDIERFKAGIYTQEKFSHIEKYGYEYVGKTFEPHITLGEVEKGDSKKLEQLESLINPLSGKEFVVDRISVLLSTRLIPSEEKVKESEVIEIKLGVNN